MNDVIKEYVDGGKYPDSKLFEKLGITYDGCHAIVFESGAQYDPCIIDDLDQSAELKLPGIVNELDEYAMYVTLAAYIAKNPELDVFNKGVDYFNNINEDAIGDGILTCNMYEEYYPYTEYAWRVFYVAIGLVSADYVISLYK